MTGALSLIGLWAARCSAPRRRRSSSATSAAYIPLVSLIGAAVGGMVGQMAGMFVGRRRAAAFAVPPLRALDSAGGVMLGALTGLALFWAVGAALPLRPRPERAAAARAGVGRRLGADRGGAPGARDGRRRADRPVHGRSRGPTSTSAEPDPAIAAPPVQRRATRSCGCTVSRAGSASRAPGGSSVRGSSSPTRTSSRVSPRRSSIAAAGTASAASSRSTPRTTSRSSAPTGSRAGRLASRRRTRAAGALLGFPLNGPYAVTPVRIGGSADVAARDAYGRSRSALGHRGARRRQSGNSGGRSSTSAAA